MYRILTVVVFLALSIPSKGAFLQSNPLSQNLIYLNFTRWDITDDATIARIWGIVVEGFNQFDANVITGPFPGYRGNVAQVIFGGTLDNGIAGISPLGGWKTGTILEEFGLYSAAAYVYADGLGNDPEVVGEAAVHEIGHNAGSLLHQNSGYMWKFVTPDPANRYWLDGINENGVMQYDVAQIGGQFGFSTLPEINAPTVLLPFLLGRMIQKGRRRV